MGLNLKALIGKLNDQSRAALEGAAGLCLSRTHYDIEVEHFLSACRSLPLSYEPTGIAQELPPGFTIDEARQG